ncbi:MAG: ABC transporter permease [Cyclobacteriaceae bacterium]
MLRNFLVIAWRSLIKNRLHTSINVLGLAIGISACIVISTIVLYERSFNLGIEQGDRVYRIHSYFSGIFEGTNRGVTTGVQSMVRDQFTGIDLAVRINSLNAQASVERMGHQQSFGQVKGLAIVDPEYFDLIQGYEWIEGSPRQSLTAPGQVVLTIDQAQRYFGTTNLADIMGQEVRYNDSLRVQVSGLVRKPSYYTDFDFTDFISQPTIAASFLAKGMMVPDNWNSTNSGNVLFIRLSPETEVSQIDRQLEKLNETYKANNKQAGWTISFRLQPLSDLHYNGELGIFNQSREPAHLSSLNTLSWIAILLLVIAAINFVNLETAQSARRAREVGVRKVLGSSKKQLILHFLTQSFLVTGIATVLSIPISEFALVFFSDFIPPGLQFDLTNGLTLISLAGITIVVAILAGLYPALGLSSYAPVTALKNISRLNVSTRSAWLRRSLIVFQFGFAQVLIVCTMVVVMQIEFLLHKDMGFKPDAIINIDGPYKETDLKRLALRDELRQTPGVERVSFCAAVPAENGFSSSQLVYKPQGKDEIKINGIRKFGDEQYIPVFGITLLAGRNVTPADEMKEVVVNETLLKEIGLTPAEAIGQELWQDDRAFPIVGVVKDFNTMSLAAEIQPVYISCENKNFYQYAVKLASNQETGSYAEAIAAIEATWKGVVPGEKFNYHFMDESIRNFYQAEERMSKLVWTAMIIAILICCLGLYGLASFTSIQRTKEIGIRKVLGASVTSIMTLLTSGFVRLVLISLVAAVPVSIYLANQFLDRYVYHINLSAWLFIAAGAASLMLAFLTVAYHAIQSATADPVQSLRTE